jgi:hypothetical protein
MHAWEKLDIEVEHEPEEKWEFDKHLHINLRALCSLLLHFSKLGCDIVRLWGDFLCKGIFQGIHTQSEDLHYWESSSLCQNEY